MTTLTTNTTTSATLGSPAVLRLVRRIWLNVLEMRARRAQTAALRQLKCRDLKDIGLIDSDISAANSLPLGSDAATALHCASLGRGRNW